MLQIYLRQGTFCIFIRLQSPSHSLIFAHPPHSFAFTSAVHDMYNVIPEQQQQSAAQSVSIILKVAISELSHLQTVPASRSGSVFDGFDEQTIEEMSSAASRVFAVTESIAMDANRVWGSSNVDLADTTYRIFQLTQRSAPSPYRRAFWLKKMADTHKQKDRPLEAAINYLELCVHASITAASSGGKLPLPLMGTGHVFPFVNFDELSHAFICPADGPVGRNAFLAAKEHVELFGPEGVLECVTAGTHICFCSKSEC